MFQQTGSGNAWSVTSDKEMTPDVQYELVSFYEGDLLYLYF
jgi:hypothetical protein